LNRIIALIPARYGATRFPGKLMQPLGNKPIIRHVYDNTVATGLFDEVWVITDSEIILQEIISCGGSARMSKQTHESGSDRIAEAAAEMNVDVVVNIQGDEPFIKKEALEHLIASFHNTQVQVATLMRKITKEEAANPNNVKVVVDKNNDALYFSRSPIPYPRNTGENPDYFLHIGIYAYKKEALLNFTKWPPSALEQTEKLEQLRYLENGIKIRLVETDYLNIAIDTPEDLALARAMISH
jgi:3-deoxy-manno-octulosonate cytidylyltransferase (CMP-KDO synthetase)